MNINYRLVRLASLSFVLLIVDLRSLAQDGRIEIADVPDQRWRRSIRLGHLT